MNTSNDLHHPDYFRVEVENVHIPRLVDAYDVWRDHCKGDNVAIWGELDFLDFDVSSIPFMMIVDIDGGDGYGRYRFYGSSVASADGRDLSNHRISDLTPPRHAFYSEEQYRWVVGNVRPSVFIACLGEKSWNRKYEAVLRLPCRSNVQAGIDRIVSIGYYEDVQSAIEDHVDVELDLRNYFDPESEFSPR